MPELENPDAKQNDQVSSILAGYLKAKDLALALGVSERAIARWHHFREAPPRVEIGRKVYYRLESVSAWIASCERPEPRAGRARSRLLAPDSLRVSIAPQRNDFRTLTGPRGGHD
jgi:predicted DNA-binding transcriptional regulator AlpA